MSQPLFTLPLISHDLVREEAIYQAAASLEHLDQCCGELFGRIEASAASASAKMARLDERISLVNRKIERMRGSKKAIQVYSSARYPVAHLDKATDK